MDLKVLQATVDNLEQLVLKLENMGFDPDFAESAEALKQAGRDASTFRKTAILSIFGATALISGVIAYLSIGWAVKAELSKIQGNKNVLEILNKENVSLQIGSTNKGKMIGVSFGKLLFLSDDRNIVYFKM